MSNRSDRARRRSAQLRNRRILLIVLLLVIVAAIVLAVVYWGIDQPASLLLDFMRQTASIALSLRV